MEDRTLPASDQAKGKEKRRVLIIGGGLAGCAAARELRGHFRVTVIDAKEYFEFTSGIHRAYADPSHWDSLTFMYHEVLERNYGVGFMWGEVRAINELRKTVTVRPMFSAEDDEVPFDFLIIAGGCNFNSLSKSGESLWFPTIADQDRQLSDHANLDERFLEGRRRRILKEHQELQELNAKRATVLIVGAGFMGVEWACELQHFFPGLQLTIIDFVPRCLHPLPMEAAAYCQDYMEKNGIKTFYTVKYQPDSPTFWQKIGLGPTASSANVKTYIVSGVKHSNYYMPSNTLSTKGPGGGGWIKVNPILQVVTDQVNARSNKPELFCGGRVFAVGDCNWGIVGEGQKSASSAEPSARGSLAASSSKSVKDSEPAMPTVPKMGYPAEQQAIHAARNIKALDCDPDWYKGKAYWGCCPLPSMCYPKLSNTWFPWGAGIFAISLGPKDGLVVVGVSDAKNSGTLRARGTKAATQKELIETTKMAQYQGTHTCSGLIWYLIHHWPINCWGRGPFFSCSWC